MPKSYPYEKAIAILKTIKENQKPSKLLQEEVLKYLHQHHLQILKPGETWEQDSRFPAASLCKDLLINGKFGFDKNSKRYAEIVGQERYFYLLPANSASLEMKLNEIAYPVSENQSVESFLSSLKTVRMIVDNAPYYGNQAANVNLIAWLRKAGMKGRIELIYQKKSSFNGVQGQGDVKLALLFNLDPTIIKDKPFYYSKELNIEFIEAKEFCSRRKSKKGLSSVEIGITASVDLDYPDAYLYHSGMESGSCAEEGFPIDSYNYANFLNANIFIQLSSFHRYKNLDYETKIYMKNNPIPILLEGSQDQFLQVPIPNLSEVKKYLKKNQQGLKFSHSHPAINTLVKLIQNNQINLFPLYGAPLQDNSFHFARVIQAALYAKSHSEYNKNKPLVIAIFFNMEEWLYQRTLYEVPELRNLKTISLEGSNAKNVLSKLTPQSIILLKMGNVPKIIFDGIFSHKMQNAWPCVREGASLLTSIQYRPHLRCRRDESDTWDINFDEADPQVRKQLMDLTKMICPSSTEKIKISSKEAIQKIGESIILMQDTNSNLSQFFEKVRQKSLLPENDRISSAFHAVIKIGDYTQDTAHHAFCSIMQATWMVNRGMEPEPYMSDPIKVIDEVLQRVARWPIVYSARQFLVHYVDLLADTIRSCETYFPPHLPNYWNAPSPYLFFQMAARNNICYSTDYMSLTLNSANKIGVGLKK